MEDKNKLCIYIQISFYVILGIIYDIRKCVMKKYIERHFLKLLYNIIIEIYNLITFFFTKIGIRIKLVYKQHT